MKKKSLRLLIFIMFFPILSSSAIAAVWSGGGADTLASTASNWTGDISPQSWDDVTFDSSSKNCTWDINKSFSSLSINGGYTGTVTLTSTLIISNGFAGKWTFFATEGTGFEEGPAFFEFSRTGTNIYTAHGGEEDLVATINGLNITMTSPYQNGVIATYTGTLNPDGTMGSGTWSTDDGLHSGTWHGARTFAQADLTGTWDFIVFMAGQDTGWGHGVINVNSTGSGTFIDFLDSTGSTGGKTTGCLALSISETGSVTIGGVCGKAGMQFGMSPDKGLIVGTGTQSANIAQLLVFRKRVDGVTYSTADINNSQYAFHALLVNGASLVAWVYGAGQTDVSGNFTFTSANIPAGPVNPLPPDEGPYQINSNGIVTSASNNTFYGIMTADKKVIFEVDTFNSGLPPYRMTAFLKTEQTFTTADLAGTYNFHNLIDGGAAAAWQTGTFGVNAGGTQVWQTYQDSSGGGEVLFQVFPFAGLSAVTDTPALVTLDLNPALIDGDLMAGAGLNLGPPPIGGDARTRNIGVDFFVASEVNTIFLWTDKPLPASVAGLFSWDIYVSSDNLNWTLWQTVPSAPFGTLDNKFEISFPNVTTRFIKVVTTPLSPGVVSPPGFDISQIYVTELQTLWKSATLPANDTFSMNGEGQMTKASSTSFHGQMSFSKDLYVRTQTQGGPYSLAIGFKR